ncbi:gamma-glutamylcyclotransferase [Pseudooceanicola sp. C21-150M6]|uniref:gamma-glutamylcyclotransferase n=1 Tax=Pseudooceanicola sp. C21-150M6 TaxID=3434355 RepID=UPI003D7F7930
MAVVAPVFLFGTLRYDVLLGIVAGRPLAMEPARAAGFAVVEVAGRGYPMLDPRAGEVAEGDLIRPDAEALARLDHYEDAFGYQRVPITVETAEGPVQAEVYMPPELPGPPGPAWVPGPWIQAAGARSNLTAAELMSYMGRFSGPELRFRRPQAEARAQSRVRARQAGRPVIGWPTGSGTVRLDRRDAAHEGYFRTEVLTLQHPRFGGGYSDPIQREVFVAADAAIVLPYDPVRDRILLVEQFRMGPYGRGAAYPWMLEPVAGRIDPGETPQDCARREAVEEAGLVLTDLIEVGSGYPSPGCVTEYHYIFVALCDLPDRTQELHGMDDEAEDIRTHVLDWAQAEDLLSRGEADNLPLVLALLWLSRERSRLRRSA